jgi:carbamoyltransferase
MADHDSGNPFVGSTLLDDPADVSLPNSIARVAFSWEDNDDIVALARRFLDGQIVGVVAGSSEIGPRALGNRSILALASFPQMKDIINYKVKAREWWRPFAPVCRSPDANIYFETAAPSRYMLMNDVVREEWRERLSSITHEDHTCRLQVLSKRQDHVKLWDLLTAIEKEGAIPVFLNTSFNRSKKPLVNSANEALQLLTETEMDAVVFQNHIYFKL